MYLKSCPICGGEATMSEDSQDRTGYYCECCSCAKSTDEFASKQAAETAWNRSRAEDLKNTDQRCSYAVVIYPFKTWWQTTYRFFLTLFGLFLGSTIIATLTPGSASIFYVTMSIFAVVWISVGTYYYIKYLKKTVPYIRRSAKRARVLNLTSFIFAHLLVLCAYAALVWFFTIPFAEKCRYG